jgi:hypothetical protein
MVQVALMTNPRNTDWILYAPKGCGPTALPSRSIGAACVRQRQSAISVIFSLPWYPPTPPPTVSPMLSHDRPTACLSVCLYVCIQHFLLLSGRSCAGGCCIDFTVFGSHPLWGCRWAPCVELNDVTRQYNGRSSTSTRAGCAYAHWQVVIHNHSFAYETFTTQYIGASFQLPFTGDLRRDARLLSTGLRRV